MCAQPLPNPARIIATITGKLAWSSSWATTRLSKIHQIHQRFKRRAFVGLPGRDGGGKRDATPINKEVEFGSESSP